MRLLLCRKCNDLRFFEDLKDYRHRKAKCYICTSKTLKIGHRKRKPTDHRKKLNNIRRTLRKQLSLIDKFCETCPDKAMERHHIIPLSKGGTNDLYNIQLTCHNCHTKIHNHGKKSKRFKRRRSK